MTQLPAGTIPFEHWTVHGRWRPTLPRTAQSKAVVIHHAVTTTTERTDIEQLQDIEAAIYGRKNRLGVRSFSMIAYNWSVSTNGLIGEGRGLRYRNGANRDTKGTGLTNTVTTSYCFAGNYHPGVADVPTLTPTTDQLVAVGDHIAALQLAGEIAKDARILPHSHVHKTACCGDTLRNRLHELRWYVKYAAQREGTDMKVCKVNRTDTKGWLVCGPAMLYTTALADSPDGQPGWETAVGPENVIVHRHMQSFFDKATYPGAGETPQIDYELLASKVADELAERLGD